MPLLLYWKSNTYHLFWVCVRSFRYPVCNAHARYCHLWRVRLYHVLFHIISWKARY